MWFQEAKFIFLVIPAALFIGLIVEWTARRLKNRRSDKH
jgi:hypothetical protein